MITDRALMTLRSIVQVSMLINVFLLANEVFKEFYSGNLHVASSKYLYLGLQGHHALVPWIWTAIGFNLPAMVLLVLPVSRSLKWLNPDLRAVHRRHLDREGHGAGHPRIHPHARSARLSSTALRSTRPSCALASGPSGCSATRSSCACPSPSSRAGSPRPMNDQCLGFDNNGNAFVELMPTISKRLCRRLWRIGGAAQPARSD